MQVIADYWVEAPGTTVETRSSHHASSCSPAQHRDPSHPDSASEPAGHTCLRTTFAPLIDVTVLLAAYIAGHSPPGGDLVQPIVEEGATPLAPSDER